MSTTDVTLNSIVYAPIDVGAKRIVRKSTVATTPATEQARTLEVSHIIGGGTKPDRHLIKFTTVNKVDGSALNPITWSIHAVITAPKLSAARTASDITVNTGMISDFLEYIGLISTADIIPSTVLKDIIGEGLG